MIGSVVVYIIKIMNSSNLNLVKMNSNLNIVYYIKMTSFHLFMINVDVTLFDVSDQLDQMNHRFNYLNTGREVSIKYYRLPIYKDGCVQFTNTNLKGQ